jgi:hypothetical protein
MGCNSTITVKDEVQLMWKETIMIHVTPYSTIHREGLRKDTKMFNQNIWSVGWHSALNLKT